ncbi:MAG: sulfatase-like hydrolase/transferase, partial [Alphaproteobacteria bacterium]|nr:sulfatase-like hydrolase/transferase [Alphaproteobacteria bacterium]
MGKVRNVLFIMCDQLRADHLSCAGHPHLETPAIDALAKRGVRFPRAYVQSGVCGPSRMSYYTGRYMTSHGATWNRVPLSLHEKTLGDYLRPAGIEVALAGKTHMLPDLEALERYGIEGGSALDALLRAGRFEEIDRYDG